MKKFLEKLLIKENLEAVDAKAAFETLANGEASEAQAAAFLMALQIKGVTKVEMLAFREVMLERALEIDFSEYNSIDVCGTGGDGKNTFNISTTSAFVVAGAGIKVAKHGNHGLSSAVGSTTVLEHLGVKLTNDEGELRRKMEEANICYLHAPLFHPAMKHIVPIRKALGIKTVFNILGPLLNPTKIKFQVTGVSDARVFDLYREVLKDTSLEFGVLHSLDGYDEVSLTGDFLWGTRVQSSQVKPQDIGLGSYSAEELSGGDDVLSSGRILVDILQDKGSKAQMDVVWANSGLAISIAKGVSIEDGILHAKESLGSGKAFECLQKLIK
ncbi:MAG: anthranilate phosphoribosyltransferase [Leadbetterella sp.]